MDSCDADIPSSPVTMLVAEIEREEATLVEEILTGNKTRPRRCLRQYQGKLSDGNAS